MAPSEWTVDGITETAARALEVFEELDDDLGLARGWILMADPPAANGRFDEAADYYRRALVHAERTGEERETLLVRKRLHEALYFGSAHLDVARADAEDLLARAEGRPDVTARALLFLSGVSAMSGDVDGSMELYLRAKAIVEEVGLGFMIAMTGFFSVNVGVLFGDAEFTEREARAAYERLGAVGDRAFRSTMAAFLGEALYQLHRYEEAEEFAGMAIALGSPEDVGTQMYERALRAKLLAVKGNLEDAERIAREGVAIAADTDDLIGQADTQTSLAEVLIRAGRAGEAITALRAAAEASDRKGDVVRAKHARARIAEIDAV